MRLLQRSVCVFTGLALLLSCSSGGGGGLPPDRHTGTATVNVTLNDPATCGLPQGPYSHIYITIADVRANVNANALPTDSGWIDFTPNLATTPVQIDLLGSGAFQCSLPAIATGTQIVPAAFQQLEVLLLDNAQATRVSNNQCGTAANCVVLASNNSVQAIEISGEAQSGITIRSTQIANGSFTVNVNETKTLGLNVNSCASLVTQGNGQLRLKPVIFAGEVGTSSTLISGRVVDGVNQGTINGGRVIVALEQKDPTGVDRIVKATIPDGAGAFSFCSLPAGNYDVVAIAVNGLNVAYGATLATSVPAGTNLGNIPVFPAGVNQVQASISGQITTAGASGGISTDLSVLALQTATVSNTSFVFTVPQVAPPAPTLALATGTSAACPANTQCVNYTLTVPVANPYFGSFVSTGTTYSQATGAAPYVVEAIAYKPESGNVADCVPSELQTPTVNVAAGVTSNAPVLSFAGCQ